MSVKFIFIIEYNYKECACVVFYYTYTASLSKIFTLLNGSFELFFYIALQRIMLQKSKRIRIRMAK